MTTQPSGEQALSAAFVDIAETMVTDHDVSGLADRLTAHCVQLLPVQAAGLLLTDDHGTLRQLAASHEHARLLERFQLDTDHHGPCLEAFHTSSPVCVDHVDDYEHLWPGFTARARQYDVGAVHALPMRLREQTIGALNLYRTTPGHLSGEEHHRGQALADLATIGILQQRTLAQHETLIEQLHGALDSRVTIEQAKGALVHGTHYDLDTAFTLLRNYARAHQLRLSDLATRVTYDPRLAASILTTQATPACQGRRGRLNPG